MNNDPVSLRNDWLTLRQAERGLHALELSERLGVSECEMLASACGAVDGSPISAIRLAAEWPAFIAKLPRIGLVKTVTRNAHAVIEVTGTYDNIEFFGPMGQSVSTIDLRIFSSRWAHGFAVREETKRGVSRGLQFFDAYGRAVHKVYLREASDAAAYDDLVREHSASDQTPSQVVKPLEPAPHVRPDEAIDVAALREGWLAMQDTHEFFGLLRKHDVGRTQALRLVGDDLASSVPPAALTKLLERAAEKEVPFMTFVGNPGLIQIFTGVVRKVAVMGPWVNVLDPGFDLHVRADRIAQAWIVRKPTVDGIVTALEIYDDAGDQIALFVGQRKPGRPESLEWRSLVEGQSEMQNE